jgi:hypothetical protein
MATSSAKTVAEYLTSLPVERRAAIEAVRKVVRENLPKGYREAMGYGMIVWAVPLAGTSVDAFIARYEASRKRK